MKNRLLSAIKAKIGHLKRRVETRVYKGLITAQKRKILVITGCGRAGTTFSAQALRSEGINIGHERLRKDGISSWYLVSGERNVPLGPSMADLDSIPKVVVHQVREPLAAISSIQVLGGPSWRFIANEVSIDADADSILLKSMKYYYYWNRMAEKISDHRVRAEYFEEDISYVLSTMKRSERLGTLKVSANDRINTRRHTRVTWEEMRREDSVLCLKIQNMAREYRYQISALET